KNAVADEFSPPARTFQSQTSAKHFSDQPTKPHGQSADLRSDENSYCEWRPECHGGDSAPERQCAPAVHDFPSSESVPEKSEYAIADHQKNKKYPPDLAKDALPEYSKHQNCEIH